MVMVVQVYDDYDDDVGEYEEEGDEYEEEEDRPPTQEEIEYLELRQKLKESIRKKMKMKKDLSSDHGNSRETKNKMPYDKLVPMPCFFKDLCRFWVRIYVCNYCLVFRNIAR